MKIDSDNALLLDMQYVQGDKKKKIPDYLYVIWKDLNTGKKNLECVPEPLVDIYFEKPEFRNHDNNKTWVRLDEVNKYTCKYSEIKFAILKEWGNKGQQFWNDIVSTRNFREIPKINLYPYVFGHDFNVTTYYRNAWINTVPFPEELSLHKSFLDIETDSFDHVGFTNAQTDPIDLVTFLDEEKMTSYTFALVGRDYEMRDTSHLNEEARKHIEADDRVKKKWHEHRIKQEKELMDDIPGLKEELHEMFDETYPGIDYQFYFYTDEKEMLVHLFELIHRLSPDFLGVWNIEFDANYFVDRLTALGLDPYKVMCHPDFPVKYLKFRKDNYNFDIKDKTDFFFITDLTIWYCQMRSFAAIRKGGDEYSKHSLGYIGSEVIGDEKLAHDEAPTFKKFSYMNYRKYFIYNIKDVLLQHGIEKETEDVETIYMTSYENLTGYADIFKQMVVLRNVQYRNHINSGFVPGVNKNGIMSLYEPRQKKKGKKKPEFDGAVVGEPTLIDNFGKEVYGKKTNYLFDDSIDMDMKAFYPSTNELLNNQPPSLIFKVIVPGNQYNVVNPNADIKYKGIQHVQVIADNKNPWETPEDKEYPDVAKEIFDNLHSRSYLVLGHKFMNLPSFDELEEELLEEME